MSDLIEQWAAHHEQYNGISHERVVRAVRVLRALEAHAGKPAATVDGTDLRDFLAACMDEGKSPNTVRQYRAMLRPFWTWAWEGRQIDGERLLRLREVKPPANSTGRSQPRPYSRPELVQMRAEIAAEYPLLDPEVFLRRLRRWQTGRLRWRSMAAHAKRVQIEAIITLALEMGLRRNEIYSLSLNDLHYDNEFVVVEGKGGKPREVPFSTPAREAVRQWIELRHMLFAPSHDRPWLALHRSGGRDPWQPMNRTAMKDLLGKVGHGWELHRLRHTCATERLRAGMPLEAVSRLLGHSSLSQTLAYAQIARPDLLKHIDKTQGAFTDAVGEDPDESSPIEEVTA